MNLNRNELNNVNLVIDRKRGLIILHANIEDRMTNNIRTGWDSFWHLERTCCGDYKCKYG